MTILWLAILILYGIVAGWGQIPALAWLLLIPFIAQDAYDTREPRERK